jgi:general secretion pathway protein G
MFSFYTTINSVLKGKILEVIMVKIRKGFTLVELLIVIVIIGILASSMLLSSTSATAMAEAATIISELRNLKAATMMFYADSMDEINNGNATQILTDGGITAMNLLKPYMDNPEKLNNTNYMFVQGSINSAAKWFVGYNVAGAQGELKEKLKGKAASTGLYEGATAATPPSDIKSGNVFGKGSMLSVWMVAR